MKRLSNAEVNRRQIAYFLLEIAQDTNECIIWPYSNAGQMGYGLITFYGKRQYTHRLAYRLTNGSIPEDLHVLHSCDNPLCFNPKHLFAGTEYDNRQDQKAKFRTPAGTKNGQAKLTESDVMAIRGLYRANVKGFGQDALAKRFGVTRIAIRKIVKGITWGWL